MNIPAKHSVSVALCTYNGETFIQEQLESILAQTFLPNEIIICDDGSSDHTLDIAETTLSPQGIAYKIIKNTTNQGVTRNFQKAMELCSGDIIFLCDQDDYWRPDKVAKVLQAFENPDCLLVFSNALLVDQDRVPILHTDLWQSVEFSKDMIKKPEQGLKLLLRYAVATGATMAVSRSLFENCTPFPPCWIHDGWLMINAFVKNSVIAIDEPLIEYRQHAKNVIGIKPLKKSSHRHSRILHSYNEDLWLQRYQCFYKRNKHTLSSTQKALTLACIEFWKDIHSMESPHAKNWLSLLLKNIFNKRFFVFSNGWHTIKHEIKHHAKMVVCKN